MLCQLFRKFYVHTNVITTWRKQLGTSAGVENTALMIWLKVKNNL